MLSKIIKIRILKAFILFFLNLSYTEQFYKQVLMFNLWKTTRFLTKNLLTQQQGLIFYSIILSWDSEFLIINPKLKHPSAKWA